MQQSISEAVENLRQALTANLNWEVQFLDIKYLNDLEAEYRAEVKRLISVYRSWKNTAEQQRDIRVIAFSNLKGEALKKTLQEYLAVYKTVRSERKFLTDVYVSQLRGRKSF